MQCCQHKNRTRARRDWQAPKVNANNSPAPGKKAATARGLSKAPGRGPGGVRHAAPLSVVLYMLRTSAAPRPASLVKKAGGGLSAGGSGGAQHRMQPTLPSLNCP